MVGNDFSRAESCFKGYERSFTVITLKSDKCPAYLSHKSFHFHNSAAHLILVFEFLPLFIIFKQ